MSLRGGTTRIIKFRIGQTGNRAYEALANDPCITITKEHVFNAFEEMFVTVWFVDNNTDPFDPTQYDQPKKGRKPGYEEEVDSPEGD